MRTRRFIAIIGAELSATTACGLVTGGQTSKLATPIPTKPTKV